MNKSLIVHGGAWNIPDDAMPALLRGVQAATEEGWKVLQRDGSSLDAVETVIRILEDDPNFDAGRGSRLNRDGKVELDASIMEGRDLKAGAVAAIQGVPHPVSIARLVMDKTHHVMLAGAGARAFAESAGGELCSTDELLVGRERDRYQRVRAGETELISNEFDAPPAEPDSQPMGTVGAVALDGTGLLAAATSTGGIQDKLAGRVGDTPIIGAGTYADNGKGAASATGWGEGILRVSLTKTAVEWMAAGMSPELAGRKALATLDRVQGRAGLILMDPTGSAAAVFNTPRMTRAWVDSSGNIQTAVEP